MKKLSSDAHEEIVDVARDYLQASALEPLSLARLARDFAEAIVQDADTCVVGRACVKHGGAVHGREAEELRAGVERLLGNSADGDDEAHIALEELHKALFFLLDHVDARDSLAFLEATDKSSAGEEKSPS